MIQYISEGVNPPALQKQKNQHQNCLPKERLQRNAPENLYEFQYVLIITIAHQQFQQYFYCAEEEENSFTIEEKSLYNLFYI